MVLGHPCNASTLGSAVFSPWTRSAKGIPPEKQCDDGPPLSKVLKA